MLSDMSTKEGKMECKIDPDQIDREGILSLIKKDCVDCNLKVRMMKGIRCKDCPFVSCSGERKSRKNYFTTGIACGAKFRQFGIDPNGRLGKSYLFYFIYYPEKNWTVPDDFELHHLNAENWNDHIHNLKGTTSSGHRQLEKEYKENQKLLNEQSYQHLK